MVAAAIEAGGIDVAFGSGGWVYMMAPMMKKKSPMKKAPNMSDLRRPNCSIPTRRKIPVKTNLVIP